MGSKCQLRVHDNIWYHYDTVSLGALTWPMFSFEI